MSEKLLVPDIGDFEEVEVIEVLVKKGDQIKKNDPVVTIESDKSSIEIPSTLSGKIESLEVKVGDKVSKGDLLLRIVSSDSTFENKPIPKDTESIIKQAEDRLLEKKEENLITKKSIQEKEQSIIQIDKNSDIDPLETKDNLKSRNLEIKVRDELGIKQKLLTQDEIIDLEPNKVDNNDPVSTPIFTPSIYCMFSAKAKFPTNKLIVKPIPVRTPTP